MSIEKIKEVEKIIEALQEMINNPLLKESKSQLEMAGVILAAILSGLKGEIEDYIAPLRLQIKFMKELEALNNGKKNEH